MQGESSHTLHSMKNLFTKENVEKEIVAIGVKAIIDMNEVTRRYLDMA